MHDFVKFLFRKLFHQNAGFSEQFHRKIVGVGMFVDDPLNSAVYDEPRAYRAGLVRAVKRCAVNGDSEFCRLNDCVLFGVNGVAFFGASTALDAEFVAHTIAFVSAVEYSCRRAVISRCQNAFVLDDNRAYCASRSCATRPSRHEFSHIHKSFVPVVHIRSLRAIFIDINEFSTKTYNIQQRLFNLPIKN